MQILLTTRHTSFFFIITKPPVQHRGIGVPALQVFREKQKRSASQYDISGVQRKEELVDESEAERLQKLVRESLFLMETTVQHQNRFIDLSKTLEVVCTFLGPGGVLILRRALWVIVVEQGKLYPFVPAVSSRLSGRTHLGLIGGSVMHCAVFLPTSFAENPKLITLSPRRLRCACGGQ